MEWENELIKALEDEIEKDKSQGLYDNDFYNDHQKYRPIYDFLADIAIASFEPKSVIDLGCGAGFMLERLRSQGVKKVYGIDGSESAKGSWPDYMQDVLEVKNLLDFKPTERYDVAICMEVAEHIPKDKADRVVKKVTDSSAKFVWWSAAQPGQGGTGHVNCQSLCYWARKFEDCGFVPMWPLTYQIKMEMLKLKDINSFPWFRDNFTAFKRVK